jgi:hypothetical protein
MNFSKVGHQDTRLAQKAKLSDLQFTIANLQLSRRLRTASIANCKS